MNTKSKETIILKTPRVSPRDYFETGPVVCYTSEDSTLGLKRVARVPVAVRRRRRQFERCKISGI